LKKLATLVATAGILAGILLAAPTTANATVTYDTYVNIKLPGNSYGGSCAHADYKYLGDALDAYNDDDQIFLCAGTYVGPFYADRGDLTIVGAGSTKTIINGNSDGDPAISVGDWDGEDFLTDNLTIANLRITNGYSDEGYDWWGDGGAVYADDFTCTNSTLDNNVAEDQGGAVLATGDVSTYKCKFIGNRSWYEGGALWVDGSMIDTLGVYSDNATSNDGGAVYIDGDGDDSEFTKATFTNNYTCFHSCPDWANGGAIYVREGEIHVTNSKFTGNETDSFGGAIFFQDYADIEGSVFLKNTADFGGAIFGRDDSNADLDVWGSTFTSNEADEEGSAIYTRDDLWFGFNVFKLNAVDGGGLAVAVEGSIEENDHNRFAKNQWYDLL